MSAKPTPGPYITRQEPLGMIVSTSAEIIATFWERIGGEPKAEANARAWVDGMAAMDTLAKILPSFRKMVVANEHQLVCQSCADGDYCPGIREDIEDARKILDEAKP